jgi:hypothetical protein
MVLIQLEDRVEFGQGNRSRGIAIAQSLFRLDIDYCIISSTVNWFKYLKANGFNVILLEKNHESNFKVEAILEYFDDVRIDFIILDGERFDFNYINLLNSNNIKTVIIDDVAKSKRDNAWRLINPNIYATKNLYKGWHIKSYLGEEYVLLRDEFRKNLNTEPVKNKILLALGVMMGQTSTVRLAEKLNANGYTTKIATGLSPDEMVNEIDTSELIICGVSVTLHEVWYRNRIALPVYQAKDQLLFHEYLKAKQIPQVVSINRDKTEVVDDLVLMSEKMIENLEPQIILGKPQIDRLFWELKNQAQ